MYLEVARWYRACFLAKSWTKQWLKLPYLFFQISEICKSCIYAWYSYVTVGQQRRAGKLILCMKCVTHLFAFHQKEHTFQSLLVVIPHLISFDPNTSSKISIYTFGPPGGGGGKEDQSRIFNCSYRITPIQMFFTAITYTTELAKNTWSIGRSAETTYSSLLC